MSKDRNSGIGGGASGRPGVGVPQNAQTEQTGEYKEFPDRMTTYADLGKRVPGTLFDTYHLESEYVGDGAEQIAWFREHTNADELIRNMQRNEKEAFQLWTKGRMMSQQYRRWDQLNDEAKHIIAVIDRYIDKSTLDAGLTVVRSSTAEFLFGQGKERGTLNEFQAQKGRVIDCPVNFSCGAAAQGLKIGTGAIDNTVEYKIRIPAGSKGAGMWITDRSINAWGVRQREFLMSRDVRYRVGNTTYDSDRRVYVVELEYLGKLTHDYGNSSK